MGTTAAFTSAGATLSISATKPATFDATGYEALIDFSEINEITDMGGFGRTYQDIAHNPVNLRQTFHFKGGYDDGGLQLQMATAFDDAGQIKLEAALNDDADYYFKLEYNDNPGGTSNTIQYFPAKVMSAPKSIGGAGSLSTKTVNIMINGDTVTVAAA